MQKSIKMFYAKGLIVLFRKYQAIHAMEMLEVLTQCCSGVEASRFSVFSFLNYRFTRTIKIASEIQLIGWERVNMCDVTIRIAERSDLSLINNFATDFFHDQEPIESSHVDKSDKMVPDDEFVLDCIDCGTTLMAHDGDKLIGVMIAGKILPDEAERSLEWAKQMKSKKSADVLKFLSYIEAKADSCKRLQVPQCLHIHIISVHPNHQGLGIAKKLFAACIVNGRSKNYPALTIDCSNVFTARIAESFELKLLSTVTYDEYCTHIGEKLFIPSQPHIKITTYAKVYGSGLENLN